MTESRQDYLVVFSPSGRRGRFAEGTPLLEAARSLGVDIDSVCGGRALCGRCQVSVSEGEFPKHGIVSSEDHLSEAGAAEMAYGERRGLSEERRLSCQAKIRGDLAIDVPETSQVHRQVVRKAHEAIELRIDPVVHAYYLEVPLPDMNDPRGDLERLREALKDEWGIETAYWDVRVTQALQSVLREGDWKVTVAIHNDNEIIAVWPGFRDRLYGMAVDVGSTTIAAHLCDMRSGEVVASAGRMNPQIRFGEDLMSRVSYIMLNDGGEHELIRVVREAINALAEELAGTADIAVQDIVEMTVVGNPIMQHLVLGYDPRELGQAPFALASDSAVSVPARDLDIDIHPGGYAFVLPCIAGHVGADMAGVLLAEAPWERDEVSLLVDVGTNAEIVLGNKARLLAASSPTGPAFEGAQISAGQRAAPGAIERVRIDAETLEPKFRVIGSELWSDEPGFQEELPPGGVTGICGSGIIEVVAELYLAGVIDADGRILDRSGDSPRIEANDRTFSYVLSRDAPDIRITQNDVRAIQLAKAALYAGCRLLMDRLGVDQVDRIRLAGAFGAHIDVKYAMVLGMIPDCDLDSVSSAGNAAGTGARIALLNRESRRLIQRQVRGVEKIETAVEERFQQHFVEAMALPHRSDPFKRLRQVVSMPEPPQQTVATRRRRRRQ
ncbi:MAG: ASKHA domain-containing protein [Lysobacterales bacterium]